jgi:hypothetical protein
MSLFLLNLLFENDRSGGVAQVVEHFASQTLGSEFYSQYLKKEN